MQFIDYLPSPSYGFCEQMSDGIVRQPINTYSSFIFVLIGIAIVILALSDFCRKDKNLNLPERKSTYGIFYGLIVVISGLGTMFYHIKLTFFGQFADFLGVNFIVTFPLLYSIIIRRRKSPNLFVSLYLLINLVLAYILLEFLFLRQYIFIISGYIFAVSIILMLISEYTFHRNQNIVKKIFDNRLNKKFIYFSIIILALGICIWALDKNQTICHPSSVFQGHAMWHILSAIATLVLYLYFHSEKNLFDILKCKISKKQKRYSL
jgi:hypothetical protein